MNKNLLLTAAAVGGALWFAGLTARPSLAGDAAAPQQGAMSDTLGRQKPGVKPPITFFSSLGRGGTYWCCSGGYVDANDQNAEAAQFTSPRSGAVSEIIVGIGYVYTGQGSSTIQVSLYADNGSNTPGAELATSAAQVTDVFMTTDSDLVTAVIPKTELAANTPYWIVITGGSQTPADWNYSSKFSCPATYTAYANSMNGPWYNYSGCLNQTFAFEVR